MLQPIGCCAEATFLQIGCIMNNSKLYSQFCTFGDMIQKLLSNLKTAESGT